MITDLTLLKLFLSDRETYINYEPYVRKEALTREGQTILADIGLFYEQAVAGMRSAATQAPIYDFYTWFHQVQHPELSETDHALYHEIFKGLEKVELEHNEEFIQTVLEHFKKEELKAKLQKSLDDPKWTPELVTDITDKYNSDLEKESSETFFPNDIKLMHAKTTRTEGLHWRLHCLEKAIGPLVKGDFGVIAAPVDAGKTAFCVTTAGYMATQIREGCVLYFTNEQTPDRVGERLWNAVLQLTKEEIANDYEAAEREYIRLMHGDRDRVKIFHGMSITSAEIRRKAKKYDAKLIIIDMLDKLHLPGKAIESENIRTQRLYNSIRELSQQFCPVIGSSQCDGSTQWKDFKTKEAKFQHYIEMSQLQESRVKKQGELEFLITIGWDPGMPKTRFVHVAKNKLPGDGSETSRYIKSEVLFDGRLSLFTDYKF